MAALTSTRSPEELQPFLPAKLVNILLLPIRSSSSTPSTIFHRLIIRLYLLCLFPCFLVLFFMSSCVLKFERLHKMLSSWLQSFLKNSKVQLILLPLHYYSNFYLCVFITPAVVRTFASALASLFILPCPVLPSS